MNFAELRTKVLSQLFPEGAPENLMDSYSGTETVPGVFTGFMTEALYDLQRYVPCYQFNNTDVYPQCSTYFNCGMTVLPAPRGHILDVYVLGAEEAESEDPTQVTQKMISPAIEFEEKQDGSTLGTTVVKAYTIYPAPGTQIIVWGGGRGVGTASTGIATVRATPTDGSAATVEQEFEWTDSYLNTGNVAIIDSAVAESYKIEFEITITSYSGNQSQWVHNDEWTEMTLIYYKTAATPVPEADWCTKVHYQQVDYCYLKKYARLCEQNTTSDTIAVADAFLASIFGSWRVKHAYPPPTDAGFEALPKLPQGYHYPQESTDATGRAPSGVWALYRGKIYIAPWIQSDETVVIEWNGIKRKFNDADLIEDDPKFTQAVRFHVGMQHAFAFDNDPNRYQTFKDQFYGNPALRIPGSLPELMHECHEETRLRRCSEAGIGSTAASARGGIGGAETVTNLFYNDRQEYTATCPPGMTGTAVTAVVNAGEVSSALSVADANARAKSLAVQRASDQLDCSEEVIKYYNVPQSYTAYCPGAVGDTPAAEGEPNTVIIEAGKYWSTDSQKAADDAALAAATAQAVAGLKCTFWNAPQTYTARCTPPSTLTDKTVTIGAKNYSGSTQTEADKKAKDAAKLAAESQRVCSTVVWNTQQMAYSFQHCPTCQGPLSLGTGLIRVTAYAHAGGWSDVDEFLANQQAYQAAAAAAAAEAARLCNFRACSPNKTTFVTITI